VYNMLCCVARFIYQTVFYFIYFNIFFRLGRPVRYGCTTQSLLNLDANDLTGRKFIQFNEKGKGTYVCLTCRFYRLWSCVSHEQLNAIMGDDFGASLCFFYA